MRISVFSRSTVFYIFPLVLLGGVFYILWMGLSLDPHSSALFEPLHPAVLENISENIDNYPALDKAKLKRFEVLLKDFRCVTCQNQSLADSTAPVAVRIKEAIYIQLSQGKTEADIKTFLVAHYGDYILYNPPLKKETFLLWFGPLCFLLIAGIVCLQAFKKEPSNI